MAETREKPERSWINSRLKAALVAALIVLGLRWGMQAFLIVSGSMTPTLVTGDRVCVSKIAYRRAAPKVGDIIVFGAMPWEDAQERYLVKRVVGVAGDRVGVWGGRIHRNGQALAEPYLRETPDYDWPTDQLAVLKKSGEPRPFAMAGEITVPEGMVLVLGDDRNRANDSHTWKTLGSDGRTYSCPFVPVSRIVGRVFLVFWPWEHARWLSR